MNENMFHYVSNDGWQLPKAAQEHALSHLAQQGGWLDSEGKGWEADDSVPMTETQEAAIEMVNAFFD